MSHRRAFLASIVGAGLALPTLRARAFSELQRAGEIAGWRPPLELADDESYWGQVQRAFDLDQTMINLNNGGCSPAPTHVLEQMIRDLRFSNELPVEHMWRVLEPRVESVRRDLAEELGCDVEELAITRNASEANMTMIFGTEMARGDEAIVTTQNYPRMINAWKQRVMRDGIVLKQVRIPTPVPSEAEYVARIAEAITPRTRVIEVMHVSFQTGYIAPVRQIVELARPKGIRVFVDGAHAFAHFPFTRDDLGALAAIETAAAELADDNRSALMRRDDWDVALGDYWEEHDRIGTDADARGPHHLHIEELTGPPPGLDEDEDDVRLWHVRQTLADPAGDHDWVIEASVDLDASDRVGEPVVLATALRQL